MVTLFTCQVEYGSVTHVLSLKFKGDRQHNHLSFTSAMSTKHRIVYESEDDDEDNTSKRLQPTPDDTQPGMYLPLIQRCLC